MTVGFLIVLLSGLLLNDEASGSTTDTCVVAPEHGGIAFPVDRLSRESACLLAEVIDHPSTSGAIGPNQTPIGLELYGYLLDHPALTARLMERLGIGTFQITDEGEHRYQVNDGEGAEGWLWIVSQDLHHRIYYIDGEHRSKLFPTVKAKTVVFLLLSFPNEHDRTAVKTLLVSYTRFEDGMLAHVLRFFKPFATRAVTAALTKEFSMTHRLGLLIVEQPHRVLEAAETLSYATCDDRQTFLRLLQTYMSSSLSSGSVR